MRDITWVLQPICMVYIIIIHACIMIIIPIYMVLYITYIVYKLIHIICTLNLIVHITHGNNLADIWSLSLCPYILLYMVITIIIFTIPPTCLLIYTILFYSILYHNILYYSIPWIQLEDTLHQGSPPSRRKLGHRSERAVFHARASIL